MYSYNWCLDVILQAALARPRASQWYFKHLGGSPEQLAVWFVKDHDLLYRWKKCLGFIQRCLAIPGPHNAKHDQAILSGIRHYKKVGFPHWTSKVPLNWYLSGQDFLKTK